MGPPYSQTEREALAVLWLRQSFTFTYMAPPCRLATDHQKPLEVISCRHLNKAPSKIERWDTPNLTHFACSIYWCTNPADMLVVGLPCQLTVAQRTKHCGQEYGTLHSPQTPIPKALTLPQTRAGYGARTPSSQRVPTSQSISGNCAVTT